MPGLSIRGGCTPGNSRLGVLVPSGDRSGPTEPAGETLVVARAHREDSARARRGLAERSERKSFLVKLFFKKASTLPL